MAAQIKNIDILMVGKTGSGKSALGNLILQMPKFFRSSTDVKPVTTDIQCGCSEFEGTAIKIVDGPGVSDSFVDAMTRALTTNAEGFHAILIVVRYAGQFTDEDVRTIKILKDIFGKSFVTNHGIVAVTFGDSFEVDAVNDETFEHWCQTQNIYLGELFKEVNNRVILFNNCAQREASFPQIRRLLDMTKRLISNGARYTIKDFLEAKQSRDRLVVASNLPIPQENSSHKAEITMQQFGRVDLSNPEKELDRLNIQKSTTDNLLQSATEQDKGANSHAISGADNMVKTVTGQTEKVERSFSMQQGEGQILNTVDADLLVVGKTGNGKSALGNNILRKKVFESRNNVESVTKDIQYDYAKFEGTAIKIVDGPGVGDTMEDKVKAAELFVKAMTHAVMTSTEGFHAILIVVRYGGRFTDEDVKTLQILKDIFGSSFIANHGILVMTCGDLFMKDAEENANETFEHWCQRQGGVFSELLKEVNNRVILFNNRATGEPRLEQIRRLLHMVEGLSDNGARYTSDIFREAQLTRDRLVMEIKRPLLQEKTIREAGLITYELSDVDHKNAEKALGCLKLLKTRADNLLQSVIEQDKGTNSLSAAISVADSLVQTLEGQLKHVELSIRLQKEEEELQKKLREEKEKSLLEAKRREEEDRNGKEEEEKRKEDEEKRRFEEEKERRKEEERKKDEGDKKIQRELQDIKDAMENLEARRLEIERRQKEKQEADKRHEEDWKRKEERREEERKREGERREEQCKLEEERMEEERRVQKELEAIKQEKANVEMKREQEMRRLQEEINERYNQMKKEENVSLFSKLGEFGAKVSSLIKRWFL